MAAKSVGTRRPDAGHGCIKPAAIAKGQWPALLIPTLVFVILAGSLLHVWNTQGRNRLNGDELHYLVIANSLIRYHTFENTAAYRDMFDAKLMDSAGQPPGLGNTHGIPGPHGLYNTHNIGLPIIIAPAVWLLGNGGGRYMMVLLGLGIPILAYGFAGLYTRAWQGRLLVALALSCTAPFLPAATQIYPDLPAGVLFGTVVLYVARCAFLASRAEPMLAAAAIAIAPWLQVKFAAASLVSIIFCLCYGGGGSRLRQLILVSLPFALSMALLAAYNQYGFGSYFGPYSQGSLVLGWEPLMVLLGLHLDQFQGVFLQAPILLLAPIGVAAMARDKPVFLGLLGLIYGSLVLPNAMHPNWYGGYSFAGRFIWTDAVLLMLPAVYALRRLQPSPGVVVLLCLLSLAIQGFYYARYSVGCLDLYNQQSVQSQSVFAIDSHGSFLAPWQRYLPQFNGIDWAFRFVPNYAWICAIIALLVVGWSLPRSRQAHNRTGAATVWIAATAAFAFPVLGAGVMLAVGPPSPSPLVFAGAQLPGSTGHIDGTARLASAGADAPGALTFGPYIALPPGRYRFEIIYDSPADESVVVGDWDIVSNIGETRIKDATPIQGSAGAEREITDTFDIASPREGQNVEIRTHFAGSGSLRLRRLVLIPPSL